jgi:hypothetical protein
MPCRGAAALRPYLPSIRIAARAPLLQEQGTSSGPDFHELVLDKLKA